MSDFNSHVSLACLGTITVCCSLGDLSDLAPTQLRLLFQVIDTGIGISEVDKSSLFGLFSKLERTRKQVGSHVVFLCRVMRCCTDVLSTTSIESNRFWLGSGYLSSNYSKYGRNNLGN